MADINHSPGPWEYIKSDEFHGAYICNLVGNTVADFYVMSKPSELSVRNGGQSKPISHCGAEADVNAKLVTRLFNLYLAGKAMVRRQADAILARGDLPADADWGLTENEIAAAQMMNGLMEQNEALVKLLQELIAIEGPQPGTGEWAGKVQKMIAEVRGES